MHSHYAPHPGRDHDWRFYGWRGDHGFVSFIVVPLDGTRLDRCQSCGLVEPAPEHVKVANRSAAKNSRTATQGRSDGF